MGWLRTLFLGDIGNRLDISDNEDRIRRMRAAIRKNRRADASQDERLALLERENEQLEILVSALAQMLAARGVIDEEELAPFVAALDDEV
ncbi:MAG: hypothetical protein CMJ94_11470 [Planctomycetes bacterium]|nr:hypothetical protein [Planctomycetota bacterium]